MRVSIGLLSLALTLSPATVAMAESHAPRVAPTIGKEPGLDACTTVGAVRGEGSGPVPVYTAPDAETIDTLAPGQLVYMCDPRGDFIGIVYPVGGDTDCAVSSPVEAAADYSGPCKSGWIRREAVTPAAG